MTHEETTRHTTHSEDFLPGDNRRKQALSARLKAIRERLGLRQVDMEKLHSTLTEGRVRQWESVTHMGARPRASGFVVLSRLFGYPYEYFWPPMPEDGVGSIHLDALLTSVSAIGEKIRAGGVRDSTPSVYRWPWNQGTPLGEVMLVVREP
ncbi:MAG TPA: hypothetical protein VIK75_05785 [Calditerricola sp.]